jgi:hypothetical protein
MQHLALSLLWALLWVLMTPAEAVAWGPATHIAIGEAVLSSLHLLPPAIRTLLERHRIPFLYGSVAADISFAKNFAAAGRHSHHWHIGEEILASADTEALRAVGFGYLSHLAADTVAHNLYVPRRLLMTRAAEGVGHAYWEHRMDVELGDRLTTRARAIVLRHNHQEADRLFDDVLSRTLFSFKTNRRLFRGMVAFQDDPRWHRVFAEVRRRTRHDLAPDRRDLYLRLAYGAVLDYLRHGGGAQAYAQDPTGEDRLKVARQLRREGRRERLLQDPEMGMAWADLHFPLPEPSGLYLPSAVPLNFPDANPEAMKALGQAVHAPDRRLPDTLAGDASG